MFGVRLKEIRKENGLTLEELAEKYNRMFNTKLNKSTLSMYENDKQEPLMSVARNLAIVLNTSVDYLTGRIDRQGYAGNISDSDLKFALFDTLDGISDDMLEDVKQFAEFIKMKKQMTMVTRRSCCCECWRIHKEIADRIGNDNGRTRTNGRGEEIRST